MIYKNENDGKTGGFLTLLALLPLSLVELAPLAGIAEALKTQSLLQKMQDLQKLILRKHKG